MGAIRYKSGSESELIRKSGFKFLITLVEFIRLDEGLRALSSLVGYRPMSSVYTQITLQRLFKMSALRIKLSASLVGDAENAGKIVKMENTEMESDASMTCYYKCCAKSLTGAAAMMS